MKFKNWQDLPLFLTLDEAGLVLGVSRSTVKRLAQKGVLPCKKVSPHSWRIDREKLREWADE